MKANILLLVAILGSVASLTACKREDPQAAAKAAAAQAAANEDAAKQAALAFDDAVAQQRWMLAKAQADVLMVKYPGTQAAERIKAQYADVKAKSDAEATHSRMVALWTYQQIPVKGGTQRSAAINAKDDLDVDGSGAKPVQLIFRDHPSWGKSAYLVLKAGDFAKSCYAHCKVMVTLDDKAPRAMSANRPKTDEAIAMFIDDERALWRMTRDTQVMKIEFPTNAVGKQTATFEVGGLQRSQMPGWD